MRIFEPAYLRAINAISDSYALATIYPILRGVILPGNVSAADLVDKRLQDAREYERRWSELVETTATRIAQGEDLKKSDQPDMVQAPAHYCQGTMQVIEAMQALMTPEEFRGHLKGCVVKYLFRYQHKGQKVRDLQKMLTYGTWLKQFETEGRITILKSAEKDTVPK